jgi:hypothetical protein
MNGMMPQGYLWDMYRHPTMPVPHPESFRDKRERRKKVERARELITVQGLSAEALQEVRGNVHKLSKDQVCACLLLLLPQRICYRCFFLAFFVVACRQDADCYSSCLTSRMRKSEN